ncbi:putative ribonuclease H-like domain-containing protein [Tanacetum coccineum]
MNNSSAPIIEDWNSDDESEIDYTVRPSTEKIKSIKTVRETDAPKQNKHHPRGNQRNWNNIMSQRLGMWNNSRRVNHKNFSNKLTHPHPKRSFVPQAVLTRTCKINTAGGNVNTAGASINNVNRPINTVASTPLVNHPKPKSNAFKRGYSQSSRPFNRYYANKNSINVNNAKGNPQQKEYKEKAVIDSGCSRHVTRNKCYLDEYEDYDGGFVSFGDGKGRISRKDKIKTRSLDFDDLLDESQVLLRVPRKDNIYSVDLKTVVPTRGLTCLIAKDTIDESNTWHRRLGHINFKTMNKLVKGNLVKGDILAKFDGKTDEGYFVGLFYGNGPNWLFDVDSLIISMNYVPVVAGNQTNGIAGTKDNIVAGHAQKEKEPEQEYILIPLCTTDPLISQGPKDSEGDAGMKPTEVDERGASDKNEKDAQDTRSESERLNQREMQTEHTNGTNSINTVSTPVSTAGSSFINAVPSPPVNTAGPSVSMLYAFEIILFEHLEEEVDMNNVISSYSVPDTSFTKFHKDHPEDQVFRNKKDERGIVVKNKARLVAQGYTQEEVKSVFYMEDRRGGVCLSTSCFEDPHFPDKVYKVEKALYGLHQAPRACTGVYVDDIIFGSTKKEMSTEFEKLMHDKFQMSSMGELSFFLGLQVQQKSDGIFISQDKYVAEILKCGICSVKTASTPRETNKALIKDEEVEDVDVHLYRSMIGSLMYLTASRPDIMFAVCTCARFQVTPKTSHLNVVKRIFRYLKGQPKLGLWYPRDSPFDWKLFLIVDYVKHIECLDTKIPQFGGPPTKVGDEAVHKELGDRIERAVTTALLRSRCMTGAKIPILGGQQAQKLGLRAASNMSNDPLSQEFKILGSGEGQYEN